jgi:hypothetical protein
LVTELPENHRQAPFHGPYPAPEAPKVKTAPLKLAISCIVLFCATAKPHPAKAQSAPQTFASFQQWNAADETTFGGVIGNVVARNPAGAPSGLNLSMTGARTGLYVNLGPNLRSDLRQSLAAGQPIQVVGLVRSFNGQNYLLARQLIIGNQTIDIRNSNGFAIHTPPATATPSTKTRAGSIGGAK